MPKISSEKFQLRKLEIIDKAFEVFSSKGYSQSSMEDIVKHSGISKGGLYTYFKSKEEIFLAIAEQRFQMRSNVLHEMTDIESASQKVTLYLRWLLDSLETESVCMGIRFTTEFWSIISRSTCKNEIAQVRYKKFEEDLEQLLLEGIQNGEFRHNLNTKSAVYLIITSLDGVGFTDAVMGIKINEATISEYINMLLNYLRG
ncbi:TetR/AcrR family transcriptional regulator [Clostridium tagluense]|uniref:TetR/AcrR family transcriptional regulator n=1 Tax=Clostridium tagluense TaxID=360422 RepID=UPI001C6EE092|nr:TetR/AcrR family transcriptional regulator [Clostridium tagluense]MBW9156173.1 TetR/AcrR family transcriptional regulator [Clostridium tagluense]WLC65588.1 TetR/AcrR family transcriptional regulator [Clostridium tagluense]